MTARHNSRGGKVPRRGRNSQGGMYRRGWRGGSLGAVALLCLLAALLAAMPGTELFSGWETDTGRLSRPAAGESRDTAGVETEGGAAGGSLVVHCLDVGQASAVLIVSGEHAMLADTGNRDDGAFILAYLEEQDIDSLDYLLLTHPHEDHIGSAPAVIREIAVDRVLMPDISIDECETSIYADTLAAIDEKQPLVEHPEAGEEYTLGSAVFRIVCPSPDWRTDAENLNESSVGILIENGENRVLLYGDGERNCESYMAENQDIDADVLIVGHHGSSTSSSEAFLQAVSPRWAIISCGADNSYGFPHRETIARLRAIDATIFRTDTEGTIVFLGDGKNIIFR